MNGIVDKARIDYGPDYEEIPPPPDIPKPESPPAGLAGLSLKGNAMWDVIKKIITFGWMKDWRTAAIVIFVVGAYVTETFLGIDIPKVNFSWEDVLIALGLSTAANHVVK